MPLSWSSTKGWARTHLFRTWTALAILAAYVYAWVHAPETLTWWKRSTTRAIEAVCSHIPYPWGDRIEATLGNLGLWVQITLAIIAFRILVWLLMQITRRLWSSRGRTPRRTPLPARNSPASR